MRWWLRFSSISAAVGGVAFWLMGGSELGHFGLLWFAAGLVLLPYLIDTGEAK